MCVCVCVCVCREEGEQYASQYIELKQVGYHNFCKIRPTSSNKTKLWTLVICDLGILPVNFGYLWPWNTYVTLKKFLTTCYFPGQAHWSLLFFLTVSFLSSLFSSSLFTLCISPCSLSPFSVLSLIFYYRIVIFQLHWGQSGLKRLGFPTWRRFLSFYLKNCFIFSSRECLICVIWYPFFFLAQISKF